MTDIRQAVRDLLFPGLRSFVGTGKYSGIAADFVFEQEGLALKLHKGGRVLSRIIVRNDEFESGTYKDPYKDRLKHAFEEMSSDP